jgi:prepilin-type N-terminal cleavage/methylation domain-containing protein
MRTPKLNSRANKAWQGPSRGFTLIEVLIALALFAIIAIVFAGGLSTASRTVLTADVRTNAESLARTEMEYVKSQNYSEAPWAYVVTSSGSTCGDSAPDWCDALHSLSAEHAGYIANVGAEPLDEDDNGIQKITVTVSHEDSEVMTLEGYKVSR